MTIGQVQFDQTSGKYRLTVDGKFISASQDRDYFEYYNGKGQVAKLDAAKITSFKYIEDAQDASSPFVQVNTQVVPAGYVEPDVNTRFEMMRQMVHMTIQGDAKAMLVTGRGGVGKTFTILDCLKVAGKVDVISLMTDEVVVDDPSITTAENALGQMANPAGDYVIYKGYATAAALFAILHEHRKRIIIFDDCDSVLKDPDAVNLLKGALDSYEDRWISWNKVGNNSTLPSCFKFEGQIIFISNLPMQKISEPIRTRCFKVDVSMTPEQRIERMRKVLPEIMPQVDMAIKEDALTLIDRYKDTLTDMSFRALMSTITIRRQGFTNWEELALYSLHQD
jgi:hypothetical protein